MTLAMKSTPTVLLIFSLALLILFSFALSSPEAASKTRFEPKCGKASWYAMTSRTASGERASPNTMTAAHRSLPFGTRVRVTNLRNGRSVIVRINDRGPFIRGRIIDVTRIAAQKLGFKSAGWTRVGIGPVGTIFKKGRKCRPAKMFRLLKGSQIPLPRSRPPLKTTSAASAV